MRGLLLLDFSMACLHFIGGEKGGVGKSVVARLLAQYSIDHDQPIIGFDSDQSHGTFSRFYDDFAASVILDDFESLDDIIAAAEEYPRHTLIVDLAAQTSTKLARWMTESDIFAVFKDLNIDAYFWHVIDDGVDSMLTLEKTVQQFAATDMKLVVVQNGGRGEDFSFFADSKVRADADGAGAHFLELPKLNAKLMQKIDFNHLSFWAATHDRKAMSTAERQRVRTWLNKCYCEFDSLGLTTSPAFEQATSQSGQQ